jgi:hypothetical protein
LQLGDSDKFHRAAQGVRQVWCAGVAQAAQVCVPDELNALPRVRQILP